MFFLHFNSHQPKTKPRWPFTLQSSLPWHPIPQHALHVTPAHFEVTFRDPYMKRATIQLFWIECCFPLSLNGRLASHGEARHVFSSAPETVSCCVSTLSAKNNEREIVVRTLHRLSEDSRVVLFLGRIILTRAVCFVSRFDAVRKQTSDGTTVATMSLVRQFYFTMVSSSIDSIYGYSLNFSFIERSLGC